MNWSVIESSLPQFWDAVGVTVALTAITLGFSTLIGAPLAVVRDTGGLAAKLVAAFSWVTRTVPVLVVLFLAFYGLPELGITASAFVCAVVGLTVQAAGYNLEIIRGGLRAVHKQQFDSIKAMGMPPVRSWVQIVLPQAIPAMIPAYFSNAIRVLKATAIASVITVTEITKKTTDLISITYATVELLAISALLYVALATVMVIIQTITERAFALPGTKVKTRVAR